MRQRILQNYTISRIILRTRIYYISKNRTISNFHLVYRFPCEVNILFVRDNLLSTNIHNCLPRVGEKGTHKISERKYMWDVAIPSVTT